MLQGPSTPTSIGSQDGTGCGDHDVPYRFGWRPRAETPFPFSTRQYARLLVLRGRIESGFASDDLPERRAA